MRHQRLQLGAEQDGSVEAAIIKRLFANAVAQQPKRAGTTIPPGQREHTKEALRRCDDTPSLECFEDHLAVGVAAPPDSPSLELRPHLLGIVDFAMVGKD